LYNNLCSSTHLFKEKSFTVLSLPFTPHCFLISSFSNKYITALAIAVTSLDGTTIPVLPLATCSDIPPTSVATTVVQLVRDLMGRLKLYLIKNIYFIVDNSNY